VRRDDAGEHEGFGGVARPRGGREGQNQHDGDEKAEAFHGDETAV
jgi:hypothetical protein